MALKMMTSDCVSSKIDPQYFVDNMLTDEDFQFETEDFLDVPLEDQNILESFRKELQLENQARQLNGGDTQGLDFVDNMDFCNTTIDDILKDCFKDADIKTEPLSPCSNGLTSPESDISVINIPDEDSNSGINLVLSETPPQTPPGLLEQVPNSPPNGSCTPIVVSLSAVPTLTYVVPPTKKMSVMTPVKPRINIQPKPPISNNPSSTSSTLRSNSNAGHSFSSDQIVKLPNGIFRVKEPVPSILKPTSQTGTTKSAKLVNGKNGMNKSDLIEVCTAALKRQERIIKNRESASLSRKRKKEYVQKIEEELNQVAAENASLKEENSRLKSRIVFLENEVSKLKAAFTSKGMKKTICLMAAVCMLTFNFASFGSMFDKVNLKPVKTETENHRVGRILLWNEENSSREINSSSPLLHNNFLKEEDDTSLIESWNKYYNTSTCQQFINKSESLRLENDLLGWVKRVEKKQKDSKLNKNSMKTVVPPLPKLQQLGLRNKGIREDIWAKRKNRNEILIFQTPRKDYEDFFDAIHRRDDSFYFISFSGDHLLLPAIAHNQTLRPRMSFVMPAMILNDSVDEADDHVSMMQIDCEVMDTKLVHIKESVIPSHLRQKHNSTSKASAKNYSKYSVNRNSKRIHDSTVKLPDKPSENG